MIKFPRAEAPATLATPKDTTMKTPYLLVALLAAGLVACGEKPPPPAPPKPKVEAVKPAEAPKPAVTPPAAAAPAPAPSATDTQPKK